MYGQVAKVHANLYDYEKYNNIKLNVVNEDNKDGNNKISCDTSKQKSYKNLEKMANNIFNEMSSVRVISSTDSDNAKEIMKSGNNNKNSKLKKIFNGIIINKMKHAKIVFEEVKEHIKYTAKEAQKSNSARQVLIFRLLRL